MEITQIAEYVNIGAFITVVLQFAKYWFLSKGKRFLKKVYWLQIVVALLQILCFLGVVLNSPAVWGVLSFMVLQFWVLLMGVKGLRHESIKHRQQDVDSLLQM